MEEKIISSENYTLAVTLNNRILANAQAAQMSLYEVCKCLKEMRDGKLYKELGYQNFEEYCETEVGISRFMAYKYITVADMNFVESIQQIGITKLSLLATISDEQREEIQQKIDVEATSVRSLKAEIDKLKAEKRTLTAQNQSLTDMTTNWAKQYKNLQQNKIHLQEQVTELEQQVQELESRPIEVAAVSTSDEVEKMRLAMNKNSAEWGKRYDALQEENLARERELHQTYKQQMDEQKASYEKQLAEAEKNSGEMQAYINHVKDCIRTVTRHIVGNGFTLRELQTALESELRAIQKLIQEESKA